MNPIIRYMIILLITLSIFSTIFFIIYPIIQKISVFFRFRNNPSVVISKNKIVVTEEPEFYAGTIELVAENLGFDKNLVNHAVMTTSPIQGVRTMRNYFWEMSYLFNGKEIITVFTRK